MSRRRRRQARRRSRLLMVAAILASVASIVPLTTAVSAPIQPTVMLVIRFHNAAGVHIESSHRFSTRDYNVSVKTKALGRAVNIRILLPTGYAEHPAARYPVLYLFHGTSGRASDWVKDGGATKTTAGLPLITVMPDAGFDGDGGGWFTNWIDSHTALGPSRWETFDIRNVIPWVDKNLRTIAHRRGRAIAGLSQGGYGAMSYAARHPDMFEASASFSGAPEIDRDAEVIAGITAIIDATAVGLDGVEPDAMFGDRATHEINWRGHDPASLLPNLRHTRLFMWTATGVPGKYDKGINAEASAIEAASHVSTKDFHNRLVAAKIPSFYDNYVLGTHTFPYWARDLRQFIGPLMRTFAHVEHLRVASYRSINRRWSQWGWHLTWTRRERKQFSWLHGAQADGFTLAGSGIARLVTPRLYRRGATATVRFTGAALTGTRHVKVGPAGRLRLQFPVGVGGARGIESARIAAATD